jgi:hypothetical protein
VIRTVPLGFNISYETSLNQAQGALLSFCISKHYLTATFYGRLSSSHGEENIYDRVTSPRQQTAYLAQLDDTAVKAVAHLTPVKVQTKDELLLYDELDSSMSGGGGGVRLVGDDAAASSVAEGKAQLSSLNEDNLTATTQSRGTSFASSSSDAPLVFAPPPVVMITSCIAAFVGLLAIFLALYILTFLRSRVLITRNSWEMLSRLERQVKANHGGSRHLFESKPHEPRVRGFLLLSADIVPAEFPDTIAESNSVDNLDLIVFKDELVAEEIPSDDKELEEFEDAISDPPTPQLGLLPEIRLSAAENNHPLLPLLNTEPRNPPISRSPTRKLLELRETTASPFARPAWSLRADEDTSLFVPPPSSPSRSLSTSARSLPPLASDVPVIAVPVPRQRAYRSPVPEFDIALAMQLRPGLGLGADSAWMVRFLMAMFGWFTVLLTGRKEWQQRRLAV